MTELYKWLWTHIGKRPWTFIYRDIWHKFEYFPQLQWFMTGVLAESVRQHWNWPWWAPAIWVGLYTYGYLNGHFFWGTNYIPNQQGDSNDKRH